MHERHASSLAAWSVLLAFLLFDFVCASPTVTITYYGGTCGDASAQTARLTFLNQASRCNPVFGADGVHYYDAQFPEVCEMNAHFFNVTLWPPGGSQPCQGQGKTLLLALSNVGCNVNATASPSHASFLVSCTSVSQAPTAANPTTLAPPLPYTFVQEGNEMCAEISSTHIVLNTAQCGPVYDASGFITKFARHEHICRPKDNFVTIQYFSDSECQNSLNGGWMTLWINSQESCNHDVSKGTKASCYGPDGESNNDQNYIVFRRGSATSKCSQFSTMMLVSSTPEVCTPVFNISEATAPHSWAKSDYLYRKSDRFGSVRFYSNQACSSGATQINFGMGKSLCNYALGTATEVRSYVDDKIATFPLAPQDFSLVRQSANNDCSALLTTYVGPSTTGQCITSTSVFGNQLTSAKMAHGCTNAELDIIDFENQCQASQTMRYAIGESTCNFISNVAYGISCSSRTRSPPRNETIFIESFVGSCDSPATVYRTEIGSFDGATEGSCNPLLGGTAGMTISASYKIRTPGVSVCRNEHAFVEIDYWDSPGCVNTPTRSAVWALGADKCNFDGTPANHAFRVRCGNKQESESIRALNYIYMEKRNGACDNSSLAFSLIMPNQAGPISAYLGGILKSVRPVTLASTCSNSISTGTENITSNAIGFVTGSGAITDLGNSNAYPFSFISGAIPSNARIPDAEESLSSSKQFCNIDGATSASFKFNCFGDFSQTESAAHIVVLEGDSGCQNIHSQLVFENRIETCLPAYSGAGKLANYVFIPKVGGGVQSASVACSPYDSSLQYLVYSDTDTSCSGASSTVSLAVNDEICNKASTSPTNGRTAKCFAPIPAIYDNSLPVKPNILGAQSLTPFIMLQMNSKSTDCDTPTDTIMISTIGSYTSNNCVPGYSFLEGDLRYHFKVDAGANCSFQSDPFVALTMYESGVGCIGNGQKLVLMTGSDICNLDKASQTSARAICRFPNEEYFSEPSSAPQTRRRSNVSERRTSLKVQETHQTEEEEINRSSLVRCAEQSFVFVSLGTNSCAPEQRHTTFAFSNMAASTTCTPVSYLDSNGTRTPPRWVKSEIPCASGSFFHKFDLYSDASCETHYKSYFVNLADPSNPYYDRDNCNKASEDSATTLAMCFAPQSISPSADGYIFAQRYLPDYCSQLSETIIIPNEPNACNPMYAGTGDLKGYVTFSSACSPEDTSFSATTYSDASCTQNANPLQGTPDGSSCALDGGATFTSTLSCPKSKVVQVPSTQGPQPYYQQQSPSGYKDCPKPAPQGPNWICRSDGTWYTNTSVSATMLSIPNGKVTIDGNLTVSGSLILNGLNSQIVVYGCVYLGSSPSNPSYTSFTLTITQQDISKLGKEGKDFVLLRQIGANDCPGASNLGKLPFRITGPSLGCKSLKSEPSPASDPHTLVVVLRLDSSRCNLWWIILIAVVCALFAIGVISLALIFWRRPSCRQKAQPYWVPKGSFSKCHCCGFCL